MNEITYRLIDTTTGLPITGKAATTVVKDSGGTPIAGLTVTEIPSQGSYKINGFTNWYDLASLWIDGVQQAAFGTQNVGDPIYKFINKDGTLAMAANLPMGTHKITGLSAATGNGEAVRWEQAGVITEARTISNTWTFTTIPVIPVAPTLPNHPVNKTYADRLLLVNTIIVDGDAAGDITGILYRDPADAVNYIHNSGSPSTSNRWDILIYEKKSGSYTTGWVWYDWINIIGVGDVVIESVAASSCFVRSGLTAKVKCKNITFVQADVNLHFNKMMLTDCNYISFNGGFDFGQLELTASQFVNCGLFYDYLDNYIVLNGTCNIINCYGNSSIAWHATDNVFGYSYILGAVLSYIN